MKSIAFVLMLLMTNAAMTQSVGIGTSTPHASARLQISSSTQGILLPTMTATQRGAINNPATGLLVFQTDGTAGFYYYAGSGWVNLTNGHGANNEGAALSSNYGVTYTLAGNERGAVDGQGLNARFNGPAGLAVHPSGDVYVADQLNSTIRKITPTGLVSTFAGTGDFAYTNGPRLSAAFNSPMDLVFDAAGNLYVADRENNVIRKIAPNGVVSTFAGSTEGFQDGAGDIAMFDHPEGLAIDAAGNIYVADRDNHRIRKIAPDRTVTTVAGRSTFGQEDGPKETATLTGPTDLAVDMNGNIFFPDRQHNKIRKATPDGFVSTYAGQIDFGEQDGDVSVATFSAPQGITIDHLGNLYVADRTNNKIRKITPAGIVSTLSGSGAFGADDGAGTVATFNQPSRVTTDAFGDVYVADIFNNRIRKIIAR